MRILYLNPDRGIPVLGDKGASVHVRQVVAALAGLGHETLVFAARLGEGNPPPPAADIVELPPTTEPELLAAEAATHGLDAASDRVTRNELVRLAYDRALPARAIATLRARGFRPELIYERHALFHTSGAALARELGVFRIVEVNAPLVREQETFRGLGLKAVAIDAERESLRAADLVIAVSDEVAAHVASCGVEAGRILVAPNGVDTDLFCPAAGRDAVRAELGLGPGPVIGFVGSFKPWHGVGLLIEAFADIARRRPDARLLAVGEGPELEPAKSRIAALGIQSRCVLTGRLPHADVPGHMAAMDVSAAPYDLGEFYFSPLKVVESLAAGVPVVAVRAGQLAELVEHGRTGLLYPPGDRAAFRDALLRLVADPVLARTLGANARARAVAAFSWTAVVSRVMETAARLDRERRAA